MSMAIVSGVLVAWAGGFTMQAIVMGVLMAASTYAQQQSAKAAAKSAKEAQERAADAAKGFQVVRDGESASLPVVYGRAKLGGVRVFSNTYNAFTYAASNASKLFRQGLSASASGNRHEYLMTQQALCIGGISRCVAVDIQDTLCTDTKFKFGQSIAVHYDGGTPCSIAAAQDDSRVSSKFTNAAFATGIFRLNRDDYQYQGIPEMHFYIEGMKVYSIVKTGSTYSLSATKSYSNNPALCLLDYMMNTLYGGSVPLAKINLASFYVAAKICDEKVQHQTNLKGKVWEWDGFTDGRDLPLYELNIALDTNASVRDNIDVIVKVMGDADLIWTAGQYKLNLSYPHPYVADNVFEGYTLQHNNIIWRALVDNPTTPPGPTSFDWERLSVLVDDMFMDETMSTTWPTAQNRFNHVVVTYLNESVDFKEDTASWPPRFGRIDGPQEARGIWNAATAYNASDIVVYNDTQYQLSSGKLRVSASTPDTDNAWVLFSPNTVFDQYRKADNEMLLEATETAPGIATYYHALAYAEQKVRSSRANIATSVHLPMRHWRLEPGDYINLDIAAIGVIGELYRVTGIEPAKEGYLIVDVVKFDANNLAWNAKDDEVVPQRNVYIDELLQATAVTFEASNDLVSSGVLHWTLAADVRVKEYIIKYTKGTLEEIQAGAALWTDIGKSTTNSFAIPSMYSADVYFAVVASSMRSKAPYAGWPIISVDNTQLTPANAAIATLTIYRSSDGQPATPTGGSFDFSTSALLPPTDWSLSPPDSASDIWFSTSFAMNVNANGVNNSLEWSVPTVFASAPLALTVSKPTLYVMQDALGSNVGYDLARGRAVATKNGADISASVDFSVSDDTSLKSYICKTPGKFTAIDNTEIIDPTATRGEYLIRDLAAIDFGLFIIHAAYSGKTASATVQASVIKAGYIADATPPPTPTGVTVDSAFSTLFISLPAIPSYAQGHGHAATVVMSSPQANTDVANAQELGRFVERVGVFPGSPNTAYNLWIKFVSVDSVYSTVAGPFAVTTGQLTEQEIADGAISTSKLQAGSVVADAIAAGAVTADKLEVNSLSAISANIGTLRTATTGARLEISDNVIKVFDSNNQLRVKIGNLAL